MNSTEQAKAAKDFAQEWQGKGYEKGDTQRFWLELLQKVFGVSDPYSFIRFEEQVMVDSTNFMDGHIDATKVLIEQKSIDKDLGKGIRQANGLWLTPFQQASKYIVGLPVSKHPRWVVTCNFAEFWVYDMEQPNGEPQIILLANLGKEYYRLQFLVDEGNEHLKREQEVSVKAGELVGVIYDKLLEQYIDKKNPETLKSLNILCVRLVFCLYAEDAGLFNSKTSFHDYLAQYQAKDIRRALIDLFQVLDTPLEARDPYMDDALKAFPYVNGGLFSDEHVIIPQFTDELKELILSNASDDFDWSEISPTIFGAVFESTLNPETRRSGGMHYTSIENIHKVIDPLFLDDLNAEFNNIVAFGESSPRSLTVRKQALAAFQDKLASLTFFDPACGSGNFLTETFLSLRRLENKVIQAMFGGENVLTFDILIKVNISQFYGIEINDFACTVAKTALWIAESQTLKETSAIAGRAIDFLPLKTNAYIHEGNALRMDWSEVIAPEKLNYIMGNPPFVGHQNRTASQMEDMDLAFEGFDTYGKLDYVAAWYKKAADMMQGTNIHAAFVSTNSICQGESVATMWKPLFEKRNLTITFAYQTFKWKSESFGMAAVHCVIIGFCCCPYTQTRKLFAGTNIPTFVDNINGYLIAAPNVFVQGRTGMLTAGLPGMTKGSQPTDGGNLFLTKEEKDELIAKYPQTAAYIKRFVGAEEFINNKERYCLWLKGVSPHDYVNVPPVMERLQKVREMRAASPTASVKRDADIPMLFTQIRQPEGNYLIIPRHSGESRRYIPIGYMTPDVICGDANQMIPDASLYLFGILISNVHMAWMRVVCGRLEMRYRYSPAVYNNFPFPTPTDAQKAKIEQTAQAILDARALYPECSLAELYNENGMQAELRKAHQENDRAVMAAYGFKPGQTTESECVAELFKMYQELTNK